ncbi:hypothetical protein ACFL4E_02955 [Candidatus Omnitrophota bacterium]
MSEIYSAKCPECGETIELDSFDDVGDDIECYSCGSTLLIKQMDPLRLSTIRRGDDNNDVDFGDIDDMDELKDLKDCDFED